MAERGRIFRWARNRSLGDGKAWPLIVISPRYPPSNWGDGWWCRSAVILL